ncbi:MAG: metalloregulator ArsR/SmtB family transcription factor [Gammaproteobacteria bacterium]|nr:metalloregulator ArsR/SmtB family transcription factor [Gammaproteobacteria bacterium]
MSNYLTSLLNGDAATLAEAFKALSNPHRLRIFQQLLGCCTPGTVCSPEQAARHCVGDLGNGLDIAASTLSHHIKELSRAGLIQMERRGQHVDCWVEAETVQALSQFFQPGAPPVADKSDK